MNFRIKIFLIISVLVLTLGYYNNFWRITDQDEFENFDIYCQSQVIGRVVRAEAHGIFSEGGLNGWVLDKPMDWDTMTFYQFKLYNAGISPDTADFVIYDSQVGGQAIMFAFLDRLSPFSNPTNLKIFWLIASLSFSILLAFFLKWVYSNYGIHASIIAFFLILISYWLNFFGRNLYVFLASFYLPFILMLYLFSGESSGGRKITYKKLFWMTAGLVFIKLFLTGFEFITTALVMMCVPVFHCFIRDGKGIMLLFRRILAMAGGSVAAMAAYAVLYSYQLSTLKENMGYWFGNLLYAFLKRTHGNSSDFDEGFRQSLESGLFYVLKLYFDARVIKIGFVSIDFKTLTILLIFLSLTVFVPESIFPITYRERKKNIALMLTTWISILAPVSWLVIFKAHSFVHIGFNEIIWFMPYALFCYVLIGSLAPSLMADMRKKIMKH